MGFGLYLCIVISFSSWPSRSMGVISHSVIDFGRAVLFMGLWWFHQYDQLVRIDYDLGDYC